MKRMALIVGIIASLAMSQIANASPITTTYADNALNWATWTASTNNDADPLGSPSIASTSVTMDGHNLQKIVFNGSGITDHIGAVFSGDLFFDTNADQTWDYVVRALGTELNASTTLDLFAFAAPLAIHAANTYELSSFSPYTPGNTIDLNSGSIRSGLPVGLLSTTAGRDIGDVQYSSNGTGITFDFGTNSPLSFDSNFIIGYAVTCANDVVYQEVPVPEPGTIALLGFGLLGMAVYGKRRMNKEV